MIWSRGGFFSSISILKKVDNHPPPAPIRKVLKGPSFKQRSCFYNSLCPYFTVYSIPYKKAFYSELYKVQIVC